jgi:hypothetical protein
MEGRGRWRIRGEQKKEKENGKQGKRGGLMLDV